jgi:hypothetical protein
MKLASIRIETVKMFRPFDSTGYANKNRAERLIGRYRGITALCFVLEEPLPGADLFRLVFCY